MGQPPQRTWAVLHGACLVDGGAQRVAVIVGPAHPARIYPLLMAAYQFTERERGVTQLVLQGASTSQIAGQLVMSPHTVQQHPKNIFAHYEPASATTNTGPYRGTDARRSLHPLMDRGQQPCAVILTAT